ncbi:hypothetical protein [Streptomyces sp. NBC_00687]|uniref:hypothetical protein n=1 Tax=Streptomyces sp. NBC_00687 TaxID=2975807 RepID=UPI00224DF2DF|nr:hypothetical protein [Streptomyces sp. NBC_00687]MCX4919826.1 hypothetical protein [Streptomyces sp. NBC_00687]
MPDERPFFVVGSGPDLTVWQIQQAPDDPDELDNAYEQHRCDADGGIEIIYAASSEEARPPHVAKPSRPTSASART